MLKLFHLMCGTTFFGIVIAMFFYIARSIHQGDRALMTYSLRASYFGDLAIAACIVILLLTATQLVAVAHFTMAVPWIFIAYHAFGTIILLWLACLLIKVFHFSKTTIPPLALKFFYLINMMIILIFMLIIHDAVTQSTWLDFLFRK
jgi:hypothetical protein